MAKSDEYLDIAYALKTLREEKNMTQGDVMRATGLERPYVSKIEAGKIYPKLKTIMKLAKALNVSMAEFIGRAESKPRK